MAKQIESKAGWMSQGGMSSSGRKRKERSGDGEGGLVHQVWAFFCHHLT
jgi:hypothetical protein